MTAETSGADGAQTFHASRAKRYDDTIRRVIPGYEALHSMTAALLAQATAGQGRILLVGTGTGAELAALAPAQTGWSFAACDPSAGMLAVAEERAQALGVAERVQFFPCTLDAVPTDAGPFVAATCLLVLHFLPDDGSKLALLRSVADRLPPGAPFIFADMYEDPQTPRFAHLRAAWVAWQRTMGIPDAEIAKGVAHVDRDIHFVSETRLASLLDEAGFTPAERFFGGFLFGGYLCHRRG